MQPQPFLSEGRQYWCFYSIRHEIGVYLYARMYINIAILLYTHKSHLLLYCNPSCRHEMYTISTYRPLENHWCMMTSWNGNISRVIGHLCGEFTGYLWIPLTKSQWCGTFMFSLICAWINGWVNNRGAGDLRRHRTHCDVTVSGYSSKAANTWLHLIGQRQLRDETRKSQVWGLVAFYIRDSTVHFINIKLSLEHFITIPYRHMDT